MLPSILQQLCPNSSSTIQNVSSTSIPINYFQKIIQSKKYRVHKVDVPEILPPFGRLNDTLYN